MRLYDVELPSRLMLGTAGYPSPEMIRRAVLAADAGVVTVSLRREAQGGSTAGRAFWAEVQATGARILPNTAGCHSVAEAITTAEMAREVFATNWIKLELIGHTDSLQPDVFQLVEAAAELSARGFAVFPYTTADMVVGERLLDAGCRVLMPWGAPIGSGQGLRDEGALQSYRAHFEGIPLIVDAGIGAPSHAARAMEIGFDGILLNTAVAKARDPVAMARAFAGAIVAGRQGFEAGVMAPRDMAVPSTPLMGLAVL